MPHSAASDLGLHCLSMSHKKDARLKWVNKSASRASDPGLVFCHKKSNWAIGDVSYSR